MDEPGEPPATSRRWFLAGGSAALLGGGAGVLAGVLQGSATSPLPPVPPALRAAIAAERRLLADLRATTGGAPAVRRVIVAATADHTAHLAALHRLLGRFRAPSPPASPAVHGTPRTLAQLRAAEHVAAAAAAERAEVLTGGLAALVASIAASEASHAALLQ